MPVVNDFEKLHCSFFGKKQKNQSVHILQHAVHPGDFFGKTAWTAGASKPSLYLSAIVVQGKTLILSVIQDYYCAILCESMSVSQLNE